MGYTFNTASLDSRPRRLITYAVKSKGLLRLASEQRKGKMKRVLILVVAAAVVGFLISNRRSDEASAPAENPTAVPLHAETNVSAPRAGTSAPAAPKQAATPPAGSKEAARVVKSTAAAAATPPQQAPSQIATPAPRQTEAPAPTESADGESARQAEPKQDPAPLLRAKALLREGKRLEARQLLSKLYLEATPVIREEARKMLDQINKDLVFNADCLEGAKVHVVKRGEVLAGIAKKYGVNWRMIARVNAVDPRKIRENQELKIITGKPRMLMDKSDFRLALFIDDQFIKEYRVGHGKNGKTPTGQFVIDQMMTQPDWYPPEGGVIHYGEKGHQLGERWLGFKNRPGATGLGIHGTIERQSVGTLCSNGCIRLLNEDVVELFDFVVPGAKVEIVE